MCYKVRQITPLRDCSIKEVSDDWSVQIRLATILPRTSIFMPIYIYIIYEIKKNDSML